MKSRYTGLPTVTAYQGATAITSGKDIRPAAQLVTPPHDLMLAEAGVVTCDALGGKTMSMPEPRFVHRWIKITHRDNVVPGLAVVLRQEAEEGAACSPFATMLVTFVADDGTIHLARSHITVSTAGGLFHNVERMTATFEELQEEFRAYTSGHGQFCIIRGSQPQQKDQDQ